MHNVSMSGCISEHNRLGVDMRTRIRSSVTTGIAIAGISALAVAPVARAAEPPPAQAVAPAVQSAAPALGAIPLAFIRNQFQYCSLICPFAVEAAITVPAATALAPVAFLGSLVTTGSPLNAIGGALASITGPANAAATPLFNNDIFLVVPKAFHALDVAVVEAFNVGAAVFTPGEFLQTVQNGRTNILGALDQAVGPPTTPTGARNILQVASVETVNVVTAVAFQAGELLLLGVVQAADAAAQELARSGDPVAALAAGGAQAGKVINDAAGIVSSAVDTAVTNIRDSLADPFPSARRPAQSPPTSLAEPAQIQAEQRKLSAQRDRPRAVNVADRTTENLGTSTDSISDRSRSATSDGAKHSENRDSRATAEDPVTKKVPRPAHRRQHTGSAGVGEEHGEHKKTDTGTESSARAIGHSARGSSVATN
jgi:hypothetical protein